MRTFSIIGRPLGHSFSKKYFEENHGVSYLNLELASIDELPRTLADHPELEGFNVTIPYKKEVLKFLDTVSPEAREIGAVNCVRIVDGRLHGHNTDVHGFEAGLDRLIENAAGIKALVLGTGGASMAVQWVLRKKGIGFRTVSRGQYEDLMPIDIARHKLIVNTTPLGMSPNVDSKPPLPYGAVGEGHFLYDLVYNPPLTAFLAEGKWRGARIIGGRVMLHAQAERNWEIWNGEEIVSDETKRQL